MSYSSRYIAMCDILGFRNFIENTSLRDAVSQFQHLRNTAIQNAVATRTHCFNRQEGYNLNIEEIPFAIFSDTLLMWVDVPEENNVNVNSIQNFFDGIAALLAYSAECRLPFRTGVSYGECYIDQNTNTYIGLPIVNAYRTEQNQQWLGGACHPSCHNAPYFLDVVIGNGLVIPYQVPVKDETLLLNNAIEWVSYTEANFSDFLMSQINANIPGVSIKYRNTMNFYNVVRPPYNLADDSEYL